MAMHQRTFPPVGVPRAVGAAPHPWERHHSDNNKRSTSVGVESSSWSSTSNRFVTDRHRNFRPTPSSRRSSEDFDSPTSRFRKRGSFTSQTSNEGGPRTPPKNDSLRFDELTMDGQSEHFVIDTSLVSMVSMDASSTCLTAAEDGTVNSDCHTETSSVAHLRTWLDDFGKQNRKHFDSNSQIGVAPPDPVTVTRARVPKAKADLPPTPLPPHAMNAFQKKNDIPRNPRSTPVRIKSKFEDADVKATNEGYKSVKTLSAWLADDPTKSKKIRSLRRGANVIAKSRAFDKGLANVIVEQNSISSGAVMSKKLAFDSSFSEVDEEHLEELETSSAVSVSDKKRWLASAFKKPEESLGVKATSDIVTNREKRDDVTARAKQLWRDRATPETRLPPMSPSRRAWTPQPSSKSAARSPLQRQPSTSSLGAVRFPPRHDPPTISSKPKPSLPKPRPEFTKIASFQQRLASRVAGEDDIKSEKENQKDKESQNSPETNRASDTCDSSVDSFKAARELLVQRSKQNGHNIDVITKVQQKKAKFEKIEKEHRRTANPQGNLKASWSEAGNNRDGLPSKSYVRRFVSDAPPKRSLDELP